MDNVKPILTVDEQIQHLKDKGVRFEIMDEDSARDYLIKHNNYFKLTSYRKTMENTLMVKIKVST